MSTSAVLWVPWRAHMERAEEEVEGDWVLVMQHIDLSQPGHHAELQWFQKMV